MFLGGSINALDTQLYGAYLRSVTAFALSSQVYSLTTLQIAIGIAQFLFTFGIFFISPIILSFALTRVMPSRQIVPPLYLQLITLGYFLNLTFFQNGVSLTTFFTLYLLGFYTLFGGLSQDSVIVRLMGKGVLRDDIIRTSLLVDYDMETLRRVLGRREFANRLDINPNNYETKKGVVFPPEEYRGWNTTIELTNLGVPTKNHTILSICSWHEGRYDFHRDISSEEYASERVAYLIDLLIHPRKDEDRKPSNPIATSQDEADDFINSIVDEAGGLVVHTERISTIGWLQIIGLLTMVSASFALIIIGGVEPLLAGVGALVSIGVYLVFALPSRFGRRGGRHI